LKKKKRGERGLGGDEMGIVFVILWGMLYIVLSSDLCRGKKEIQDIRKDVRGEGKLGKHRGGKF